MPVHDGSEWIHESHVYRAPKPTDALIEDDLNVEEKLAVIRAHMGLDEPAPTICMTCGQPGPKTMRQYRFDSQVYAICPGCAPYTAWCKNCGFPVRKATSGQAPSYCRFCERRGTCASCKVPITPENSVQSPGVRGAVCLRCYENASCYGCGRHTRRLNEWQDGRKYCVDCHSIEVADKMALMRTHLKVIRFFEVALEGAKLDAQFQVALAFPTAETLASTGGRAVVERRLRQQKMVLVVAGSPEDQVIAGLADVYAEWVMQAQRSGSGAQSDQLNAGRWFIGGAVARDLGYPDTLFRRLLQPQAPVRYLKRLETSDGRLGLGALIRRLYEQRYTWDPA